MGDHGGVCGESWRVLGDFGDCFCSVIACFFASNNLKLVFSSSCGAMYDALPVLKSNDDLIVSGNHFRRVRHVDMKHDFAFVVCSYFLPSVVFILPF